MCVLIIVIFWVFCNFRIYFLSIQEICGIVLISSSLRYWGFCWYICCFNISSLDILFLVEDTLYGLDVPSGSVVKNLPAMQEIWIWSLGWEDAQEKELSTHSSILAWETPCTEEPVGPWGYKRVGYDLATKTRIIC